MMWPRLFEHGGKVSGNHFYCGNQNIERVHGKIAAYVRARVRVRVYMSGISKNGVTFGKSVTVLPGG